MFVAVSRTVFFASHTLLAVSICRSVGLDLKLVFICLDLGSVPSCTDNRTARICRLTQIVLCVSAVVRAEGRERTGVKRAKLFICSSVTRLNVNTEHERLGQRRAENQSLSRRATAVLPSNPSIFIEASWWSRSHVSWSVLVRTKRLCERAIRTEALPTLSLRTGCFCSSSAI